jgi:hypothetical protein
MPGRDGERGEHEGEQHPEQEQVAVVAHARSLPQDWRRAISTSPNATSAIPPTILAGPYECRGQPSTALAAEEAAHQSECARALTAS